MRILIIEKQFQACQNLKSLLNAWYLLADTRESTSVCETLHLLEEFRPDAILMDVRIPNESGLDAIQQIKKKYQSIVIIVLSMKPELETSALTVGADAFIRKSDPPAKLHKALVMALQNLDLNPGYLIRVSKAENAFVTNYYESGNK
jgi:DNA-binding NarL/FixJ family response regulator